MEAKYRYVVCHGSIYDNKGEFIADCATEGRAADFCAEWVRDKMLNAFEEKDKIVFGGIFNLAVHKIGEK